jgi:hypothetical protein
VVIPEQPDRSFVLRLASELNACVARLNLLSQADRDMVSDPSFGGTPGDPTTIDGDAANDVGNGPARAYYDHQHDLDTSGTPGTVGATSAQGAGPGVLLSGATARLGIVTAKGDSLTHNGTDPVREAVGADDTVLMAKASQTTGRWWRTVAQFLGVLLTGKGQLVAHNGTNPVALAAGSYPEILGADANQAAGVWWAKPWWPYVYKDLTDGSATSVFHHEGLGAATAQASGLLVGKIFAHDATVSQTYAVEFWYSAVSDAAGALTIEYEQIDHPNPLTAGTLTVTIDAVDDAANDRITIRINANTSIATPTELYFEGTLTAFDFNTVTML